jgi:SAM-dependent methyltransferase
MSEAGQQVRDGSGGMFELSVHFAAPADWARWRNDNAGAFDAWRERVVAAVKQVGFAVPIEESQVPAGAARIVPDDLRESIGHAGLNARKRALLLQLQLELEARGWTERRDLRILAPEALSRVALILRGRYPFFHATEYLPTAEEQQKFLPVPHLDLERIPFADESFDIILSGDVLEHVADPGGASREMARVLKPGGFVIATFPFDPAMADSRVCARRRADGQIEHLVPPAYHGNPLDSVGGSLVFSLPGWDILDTFRRFGCTDSVMSLLGSSRYGIVSNAPPGVFVMSAAKPGEHGPVARRSYTYFGRAIDCVVGLIAPPRSGTTLLTSMFAVHSDFDAIYEPWNGDALKPDSEASLESILALTDRESRKRSLFVKETGTKLEYIDKIAGLLDTLPPAVKHHLVLLVRNPAHTFSSEIERRQQWWGASDLTFDQREFEVWCSKTQATIRRALKHVTRQGGIVMSYDALVAAPKKVLGQLSTQLGVTPEPAQLSYEKHLDRSKVRGDLNVTRAPAPITGSFSAKRKDQESDVAGFASCSPCADWYTAYCNLWQTLTENGVMRIHDIDPALRAPLLVV